MSSEKLGLTGPDVVQNGSVADTTTDQHTFDNHQIDTDDAFKAVSGTESLVIDDETNKRLRRKIDLMVMPVLQFFPQLYMSDRLN